MSLTDLLLRDWACAGGKLDNLWVQSLCFSLLAALLWTLLLFLVCGMIPKTTFIYLLVES